MKLFVEHNGFTVTIEGETAPSLNSLSYFLASLTPSNLVEPEVKPARKPAGRYPLKKVAKRGRPAGSKNKA
jgi:hypothetical protein